MSRGIFFRRYSSNFYFFEKIAPKHYFFNRSAIFSTESNEIFIPTCFPRVIDSKIFQEKINLDSLKNFHSFLLSYQPIEKTQPMKSTAPSAYSPAPAAWCQSWLFTNEYAPIKDIPAHASPADRIHSTATTTISETSLSVYLNYTPNFGKCQEKYFLDECRLNFL